MPIPAHILSGLAGGAAKLGTPAGYTGYGAEQGVKELREKIAKNLYDGLIEPEEVFVSDGAKCDIARLQLMFGSKVVSAVQDPSYPVYVDTSVMLGQTGDIDPASKQFKNIVYMPCNPSNDFFPDLSSLPHADVIYFCSPNNPTGAVATRKQLTDLVNHAKEKGSFVVFDAAYAPFIRSPGETAVDIDKRPTVHLVSMSCNEIPTVHLTCRCHVTQMYRRVSLKSLGRRMSP